ncbi:MAG: bifunctional nuclease family protein [Acidimicrobiia bacterium]|nr:bifunctional nuclease family protein [Acidimicrobiia bacterium]
MKQVDLAGLAIEVTAGLPVVILREHDEPHRLFPILIGGTEAAAIAMVATGQEPPRPMTHDLMATVLGDLGGRLESVELSELGEGVYAAVLNIHGPMGGRPIDARPSDAIALALRLGALVFVSDDLLDEVGSLSVIEVDLAADDVAVPEADIDQAVAEFRTFLDDIDASQFELGDPGADAGQS